MRRVGHRGMSPFAVGLLCLLIVGVLSYAIFAKSVPLQHHYTIKAVVENSNLLRKSNPVRIGGVEVGRVSAVERYGKTNMALITMRISDKGKPVKTDATLKIRPRLFLEGNFYVDLKPGSPGAKELGDGDMLPVTQTAGPVQLDQFLGTLQSDTRASLQTLLQGFGDALDSTPDAAEDARQDPDVAGLTGAQALNKTFETSVDSLRDGAIVANAFVGPSRHDLSQTFAGFARASKALADNEQTVTDFVSDFNTTMAALSRHSDDLRATVRLLGPTAASAHRGFASLAAAMPPTRRFARDLIPGVKETPASIAASDPWLAQALPLLSDQEIGGLLAELRPATTDLARLGHETREFLPRIDAFNRCVTKVLIPTGNTKVDDGPHSAGVENYKEFWYAMVGQNGEAQHFDGNGTMLRLLAAGGTNSIETGKAKYDGPKGEGLSFFANPALAPQATKPAFPNKLPELRRDIPCASQPVPDVNGPASTGPADGSRPGAAAPAAEIDPGVKLGGYAHSAGAILAALSGSGS
ncbi:MAG: MlaD family protein [Solirubrobacteraceae bacterium]